MISIWREMYKMLELLLKKAAHRCKMKGIVFKVEGPIDGLALHSQTGFTEEIELVLSIDGKRYCIVL